MNEQESNTCNIMNMEEKELDICNITSVISSGGINNAKLNNSLQLKVDDSAQPYRCLVCSTNQPMSAFVELSCKHRFCIRCTSMVKMTQICPLCFTDSSSVGLFPLRSEFTLSERATNLSSDGTTSIWGQSVIKSNMDDLQLQAATVTPIQRPITNYLRSEFTHDKVAESSLSSDVTSVIEGGLFPVTQAPVNAKINWLTLSEAELRSIFEHAYPTCPMCPQGKSIATMHCLQCNEPLCNECVIAHFRVRQTRDHNVIKLIPQQSISSAIKVTSGGDQLKFENLNDSEVCASHHTPFSCTCITCGNLALCSYCVGEHTKHQLIPYGELRVSLLTLIGSSKRNQKKLEEALETIGKMSEKVDASVQCVVRDVRAVIYLHINALEEKKEDLLQRVDTIRLAKLGSLKLQSERIGQRLLSLTESSKNAEMAASLLSDVDGDQARAAFDAMLSVLREPNIYLIPCETDSIRFIPPESSLMYRIRNFGEIDSGPCASMSYIVGESYRCAIRNHLCTVHVQIRDACGNVCTSANQPLFATLCNSDGYRVSVKITEREGGLYALKYCPTEEGTFVLDVTIRGNSISGCPAYIHVRNGRDYSVIAYTGPLFSFGSEGSGDGQFCRPWGICCDHRGRLIVADRSNNRIQIFDKDGNFLHKFGSLGSRPGQFDRPAGIAVNSSNEIVVADKDNHRIQVFNEKGDFLLKFGDRGRAAGLFHYPWGVAVNSVNQIAVCDTRNHRVQIFSHQGQYIRKCGFDTSIFYKNLDSPRGVCFLQDGQLVITDFNNHRLAVVSSHGLSDMKCYGGEGDGDGFFCRPQGLAVDSEGHILVCDSRNNRVQVLNADKMDSIASFGGQPNFSSMKIASPLSSKGTTGSGTSNSKSLAVGKSSTESPFPTLERPTDLCVSPEGLIYVIDFGGSCVRVY